DGAGGFSSGSGPGHPAGSGGWINPARSAGPFRLPGSSGVPPSGGRTAAQNQITFFGVTHGRTNDHDPNRSERPQSQNQHQTKPEKPTQRVKTKATRWQKAQARI